MVIGRKVEIAPYLTICHIRNTIAGMETIIFKAPAGTKEKLRALNPNVSDLLRQAAEKLIRGRKTSMYERYKHLMFNGNGRASRGKEYLKIYEKKRR